MSVFISGFGSQMYDMFRNMTAATWICLIAGLVLVTAELFRQTRGALAVLGGLSCVAALILAMAGSPTFLTLFAIVFIIALVINGAYILRLLFFKRAWLLRTPNVSDHKGGDSAGDYYFLLNLEGVAITDIKSAGRIMINEVEFDVINRTQRISAGDRVRVVEVEGRKIVVKAVKM